MYYIDKLGIVLFLEEGIKILEYDTHLRPMFRIFTTFTVVKRVR